MAPTYHRFFQDSYSSDIGNAAQKRERWEKMTALCRDLQREGREPYVHLPMSVLMDARSRMMPGKQGGIDGVVSEAFHYLEWESLEALRLSFEKRLNCESPHDEIIEEWRRVLVRCAPKCAASHRLSQWRPISLTNALSKWYLSCVTYLLRVNMSKPTASLLGFEPGRQCMEISEFTRLLLVRAQEWGLPVHIGKGDAHKAFDSTKHRTRSATGS